MTSFVRRKLEKFSSGVEWDSSKTPFTHSAALVVPLSPAPMNSAFGMRRNETLEKDSMRLQGLMRKEEYRESGTFEESMKAKNEWKAWMVNEGWSISLFSISSFGY